MRFAGIASKRKATATCSDMRRGSQQGSMPGSTLGLSTALRDHSILPTETLVIVVTADKLDIPTVYRRTSIADKAGV